MIDLLPGLAQLQVNHACTVAPVTLGQGHDLLAKLAVLVCRGLVEQLHFCWVDAEKLASMGFLPVVLTKTERDALDEATHRKWRNAKLYPISKLQDIRATIGASMRDACCEMRLLGRELANAETELPSGRSIVLEVAPGQTTVSLDDGEVTLTITAPDRPLHAAVRYAIQCALAEAATAQHSSAPSHQKQ